MHGRFHDQFERIFVILPLTLLLLLRLLQLWLIERSCSLANLSRVYRMKVLEKNKKTKNKTKKRKEEESKETKLLIIIIIIIITTTTTIILSYWNTVELPPSDKQTLHFNLPKATTVPTGTHLSLTGGSTDCIKLTKKVLSIENPKLRANISSKSLGLHQRCELTGYVAENLWIPKRGLLYCKLLVGPQNVRVQGGGSRQKVNIGLCGYLLWVLEFSILNV